MLYRHSAGSILTPTGRVIDPDEAEALVRIWHDEVVICRIWGRDNLALVFAADALSLGRAWLDRRDWGLCSAPTKLARRAV